jgi:mRNA interferase MazF
VLTRSEVIDARELVTVAEITTSIRGLAAEVGIDHDDAGLDEPCVINCDGIHTVTQSSLTRLVGEATSDTMSRVCASITYALGC